MFSAPQAQRVTGNALEFPFNQIGEPTMAFLTCQSWRVLKSWYTGGSPEQDFTFQTVLTTSLVLSEAQATHLNLQFGT